MHASSVGTKLCRKYANDICPDDTDKKIHRRRDTEGFLILMGNIHPFKKDREIGSTSFNMKYYNPNM